MSRDHNILFGILAVQMDFLSRDALITGMHAHIMQKDKSLAAVLLEQGALTPERHALLASLVREHLKAHGEDAARSLLAVRSSAPLADEVGQALATLETRAEPSDAPPAAEPEDPLATRVGPADGRAVPGSRFRTLRPLGKGGLGQVFVALDTELNREVALKQIREHFADHKEAQQRFLLEGEVTGGLEHPGIVPVYSLGRYADGRPFYAMRFIRGDTLEEVIERFHSSEGPARGRRLDAGVPARRHPGTPGGDLELRRLLQRFIDVCNAVSYAHSKGWLHRDLKPSNVMLGPHGETLLLDWGLAKKLGGEPSQEAETLAPGETPPGTSSGEGSSATRQGQALGTPAFMSPEQAAARHDELGPASDVYGLGATLYHLLTGKAPFGGDDLGAVLRKVERGDFPRPRQVNRQAHPALEAVCLKAMALRPRDRYPSAKALAEDLERWLAEEPVSARREPLSARLRRFARRHWTLLVSLMLTVSVALAAGAVGLALLGRKNDELNAKNDLLGEQNEKLNKQLYYSQIGLAGGELAHGNSARAGELLDECKERLRNWEWHYLQRLQRQGPRGPLATHQFYVLDVAFSPDGRLVASASLPGQVRLTDAATGAKVRTFSTVDLGKLRPADLIKLAQPKRWVDELARVLPAPLGVAFSPDGKHLATAASSIDAGAVKVWEVATGREVLSANVDDAGIIGVAYSPDGRLLAACGWDGLVRLWNPGTGKVLRVLRGHEDTVYRVAFSPDGRRLASASWDGSVRVWDPETGREVHHLGVNSSEVWSIAYSPDGKKLAAGTLEGVVQVWDTASGERQVRFASHLGIVYALAFSADGKRIACGGWDKTINLHDAETGQEVLALRAPRAVGGGEETGGHRDSILALAFSPDGDKLVSGGWDGQVILWDATPLDLSAEAGLLRGHAGVIFSVAFSPDGRRVASAGLDRTVRVHDVASRRELLKYEGHDSLVFSVAFSPDGKRIASGGFGRVNVWDAETGEDLVSYRGQRGNTWSLAFSPDGRRVVSSAGQRGLVAVWDSVTGKEFFTTPGHLAGTASVAFSPDGRGGVTPPLLATAGNNALVRLWDAATGKELHTFTGHGNVVRGLAFSPDGKRLATADWDGTVIMWEVVTRRRLLKFQSGQGRINSLAFSPDGQALATAGTDGPVKLWGAATGKELHTFRGHAGTIFAVAFSPDGKVLATAGGHRGKGEVRLWDLPPGP